MARALLRAPPKVRWFIVPPMADETLESVLERAHQVYHGIALAREGWLVDFCRPQGHADRPWDSRAIARVAQALGVPATRLHAARVPDTPATLAPASRRAYCRGCWVDDDRVARPRYFRRAWAGALSLRCGVHGEPFRLAPSPISGSLADIALSLDPPPLSHREAVVMEQVDRFADTLQACLFGGAAWPATWRLDAVRARNLLGRCVSNLLLEEADVPSQWPWLENSHWVRGDRTVRRRPATRGSVWESFRQIGSPAERRAALWLTAFVVMPVAADEVNPRGMDEYLFRQDLLSIARQRKDLAGRRMTRLRRALARESEGWSE